MPAALRRTAGDRRSACAAGHGGRARPYNRPAQEEAPVRSDLMSGPRPSQDHGDGHAPTQAARPKDGGTAAALEPLLDHFFGGAPPVRFEFWDGTSLGPPGGQVLEARSADGVRRLLWAPGELGLARAFVEGDLSFRGDLSEMLALLHAAAPENVRTGTRLP